jgi:hypothetical protein
MAHHADQGQHRPTSEPQYSTRKRPQKQLMNTVDRDLTVSFTLRLYSGDSTIALTAEHAPKAEPCSHAVAWTHLGLNKNLPIRMMRGIRARGPMWAVGVLPGQTPNQEPSPPSLCH